MIMQGRNCIIQKEKKMKGPTVSLQCLLKLRYLTTDLLIALIVIRFECRPRKSWRLFMLPVVVTFVLNQDEKFLLKSTDIGLQHEQIERISCAETMKNGRRWVPRHEVGQTSIAMGIRCCGGMGRIHYCFGFSLLIPSSHNI